MPNISKCRECGSTALTWDTHNKNVGQAPLGRLRAQDIRCQFVLGCDHCSETLAVVSADRVAAWLTGMREVGAEPTPFPSYPPVPEDRKLPAEPSAPVERADCEHCGDTNLEPCTVCAALERKP